MFLTRVRLKNWKSFQDVEFNFPPPSVEKPLVLIGGKMGRGKTSFLEAIFTGMYGKLAYKNVQRLRKKDDGGHYNGFISAALNNHARRAKDYSIQIELRYADEAGNPFSIFRTWLVADTASRRPPIEQLRVEVGGEAIEKQPDESDEGFVGRVIARRLVPPAAIGFFHFDAEQLGESAFDSLPNFVLKACDDLTGALYLQDLTRDLRKYADDLLMQPAEDSGPNAKDKKKLGDHQAIAERLQKSKKSQDDLAAELEPLTAKLADVLKQVDEISDRISDVASQLDGFPSNRRMKDLVDEQKELQAKINRVTSQIADTAAVELAPALLPDEIVEELDLALVRESELEAWENTVRVGRKDIDTLVARMTPNHLKIQPELRDSQFAQLATWLEETWLGLHHPRPAACATGYSHGYLSTEQRAQLQSALRAQRAPTSIQELGRERSRYDVDLSRTEELISRLEGLDDRLGGLISEFQLLSDRKKRADTERQELENKIKVKAEERAMVARDVGRDTRALEDLAKTSAERELVENLRKAGDWLRREVRQQLREPLARKLESIYQSLSDKKTVRRVEIGNAAGDAAEAGRVHIFDQGGEEISLEDHHSMGELQVVVISLILAAIEVTGRNMCIISDTPLARLSLQVRKNLLKLYANHGAPPGTGLRQVILLSADTEVTREELTSVKDAVAGAFLIEYIDNQEHLGFSRIVPNIYFEKIHDIPAFDAWESN